MPGVDHDVTVGKDGSIISDVPRVVSDEELARRGSSDRLKRVTKAQLVATGPAEDILADILRVLGFK